MIVTADAKKRVVLPVAKPGDSFNVQVSGEGTVVLRRLDTSRCRPAKVRFKKRGRFTVGILDRPINDDALREALAEFP
jgi:hypothetical protein